ncbi:MAG: hypothetical protein LBP87_08780, partial [Planctomycetaceae bacterium]|nr:hypothetical protein [Planctomycetaceae bacterium]
MESKRNIGHTIRWLTGRFITVTVYMTLFALAYWLAFAFRYDFDWKHNGFSLCYQSISWVLLLKMLIFFLHRHFHAYGFYATFKDFQVLVKSSVFASVGFFVLALYVWGVRLPRTVPVMDCLFTIFLIGTVRFGWRILQQEILPRFTQKSYKKTLIIGANYQGVLLAQELYEHPELGYKIVGFVSLRDWKIGRLVSQIP